VQFVPKSISSKVFAIVSLTVLISYLVLSFCHFLLAKVESLDESIPLTGAFLISRGFSPHIDFWSMYPALNYYLISFVFSWLGPSAISARILQEFLFTLLVICLYFGFKAFVSRGSLFSLNFALIFTILMANAFTYVWWNAYALAFLGLWLYIVSLQKKSHETLFLFISGFLTGLACLAKLNFGSYVVMAVVIGLAIETLQAEVSRAEGIQKMLLFLLPVFLCMLAYLIPYGTSAMEVLNQILIFPSQGLERHRILTLPEGLNRYGSLISAVFPLIWMGLRSVQLTSRFDRCAYVAFSSAALSLAVLFVLGTKYQQLLPKFFLITTTILVLLEVVYFRVEKGEFTTLIVYSLFTNYFLSRMDAGHFTVLVPVAVILIPYLLQQKERDNQILNKMARYSAGVLIIALCASPTYWHLKAILSNPREDLSSSWEILKLRRELGSRSDSDLLMSSDLSSSPFARLYPEITELQAARFVAQHTAPEDSIYIGLKDHSRVYMSPTRLFWITGRNAGVKHYMLEPGFTTEESIQRQMIADLKNRKVVWMILRSNRAGDEDFERRNYRGARILDDYIRENYKPVQEFGNFTVYNRRS